MKSLVLIILTHKYLNLWSAHSPSERPGWLGGMSAWVSGWVSVRLIGWPGLVITIIIVSRGRSASLVTISRTGSIILAATFNPFFSASLRVQINRDLKMKTTNRPPPFAWPSTLLCCCNRGYFKLSYSESHVTSAGGMVLLKFIINTKTVQSGHIIICIREQKETRFCVSEKNYPIFMKINKNSTRYMKARFSIL